MARHARDIPADLLLRIECKHLVQPVFTDEISSEIPKLEVPCIPSLKNYEEWEEAFFADVKTLYEQESTVERKLNGSALKSSKPGSENFILYDENESDKQAILKKAKLSGETIKNSFSSQNFPTKGFVSAKSRYHSKFSSSNEEDDTQDHDNRSTVKPFKPPTFTQPHQDIRKRAPLVRKVPTQPFSKAPITNSKKIENNEILESDVHPRLRGIDAELVERIENEILEIGQPVCFDDIAGLNFAKQCIEEMIVWPVRNPEFYTGLRQLPKGLLLFGPPGTGKTVLGKAIAHECKATFFSISASSLTSKWIGEGEKLVRALFAVAASKQPAVVFIDEIDSLLTQRSSDENEASRRIKTEFLVQFDGTATSQDDIVLVIGATNRPQELDEAARRRFVRRLYIPLPDPQTRCQLLSHLLKKNENTLSQEEIQDLGHLTEGYSGADVTNLAREASMGPLREMLRGSEPKNNNKVLRPINRKDFDAALRSVKASVSFRDLAAYEKWNSEFGSQQYLG